MNSRQRFLETMGGGQPDHPPLFPEGIRSEVLRAWRAQGLSHGATLEDLFHYDAFEELAPDLYPRPWLQNWSDKKKVLRELQRRLDPYDPRRLPKGWHRQVKKWRAREHPLFLRLHEGLFLTLGIEDWQRFAEVAFLLADDPDFVCEVMALQAQFNARLAEKILNEIEIDAAVFSEPIAGPSGALISPRMYRELVLSSLSPIFEILARFKVPVLIWRSYASPHELLPSVAQAPFNALWLCETNPTQIDYLELRTALGPDLGLIGGIDTDVIDSTPIDIRRAVAAISPLLAQGRYLPLADGRVRAQVPFENYRLYRKALEEVVLG